MVVGKGERVNATKKSHLLSALASGDALEMLNRRRSVKIQRKQRFQTLHLVRSEQSENECVILSKTWQLNHETQSIYLLFTRMSIYTNASITEMKNAREKLKENKTKAAKLSELRESGEYFFRSATTSVSRHDSREVDTRDDLNSL